MPQAQDATIAFTLMESPTIYMELCTLPILGIFELAEPLQLTYVFTLSGDLEDVTKEDVQPTILAIITELISPADFGIDTPIVVNLVLRLAEKIGFFHVPTTQEHIDENLALYSRMCVQYEMRQSQTAPATDTLQ